MKKTINRKGNPGLQRRAGRPDRSKAPLITEPKLPEGSSLIIPSDSGPKLAPITEPKLIKKTFDENITPSGYPKRRKF